MTNDLPANLSRSAKDVLTKWGVEACRTAWHMHHLRGEGPTVQSIESGIPLRSVASAVNAYAEVWASLFPPKTPSARPTVLVSPEEIAAAVRRTDCASVTLTDAQRERAAVLLADALRDLIATNLPRLIGNAQLDAAEDSAPTLPPETTHRRWEVWTIDEHEDLVDRVLSTDSESEAREALSEANQYQYGLALVDRVRRSVDWGDRTTALCD